MNIYSNYGLWEMFLMSTPCVAFVVFWYYKKYFTYWASKGVDTSKPNIFFGNAKAIILQRQQVGEAFAKVYEDCQKRLQSFRGYYFFTKPILVVADLNLIKQIMTTDFKYFTDHVFYCNEAEPLTLHLLALKYSRWLEMRPKLSPLFTPAKLKALLPNIVHYTEQLVSTLNNLLTTTGSIEINNIISRYSIDVIVSSTFGLESNVLNNEKSDFLKCAENFWNTSNKTSFIRIMELVYPEILLKLRFKVIQDCENRLFINTIKDIIGDERIKYDFFHSLMQIIRGQTVKSDVNSKLDLSVLDLAAQSYIFFIAGYETTSSLILFCLYELAVNNYCQQKVRDEVNTVLKNHEGDVTFEALSKMTYLEMCIKETLRKYPPTTVHRRECTQSYNIPTTAVTIEKGTSVFIPALGIHHDPKLYPNPTKFEPERFSAVNVAKRHSCAWIPFGYGPRMCIGFRFGLLEAKIAVALLIKNFKLSLNSATKVPITYDPKAFLLKPDEGIWLNIEHCNISFLATNT